MSQGCTIVSWLLLPCFCIPSFSRLANAWTCLFELRESKEAEWSLSSVQFSSVQSLSRVWLFVTPWTAAHQASLYITGVYSDSCPLRQWCHPTISSSVALFSSCLESFPASASFLMSQLFTSGGQSFGAAVSVLPMNIQGWFPLGLTGLISVQSKGPSGVFSSTTVQRHPFCSAQPSLRSKSRIWGLPWWLSW